MKKKIIVGIIIIFGILAYSINAYAISFNLEISGNNRVEINKTLQLKAEYWVGNDMPLEPYEEEGKIGGDNVTDDCSWKSSNTSIATIDNSGLVTGVSEGKVIITAEYKDEESGFFRTDDYEIIIESSESLENSKEYKDEENNFSRTDDHEIIELSESPVISPIIRLAIVLLILLVLVLLLVVIYRKNKNM